MKQTLVGIKDQFKQNSLLLIFISSLIILPFIVGLSFQGNLRNPSSIELIEHNSEDDSVIREKPASPQRAISIPFTGFIQNVGQLTSDSIQYYYSTEKSSIGFGTSIITFIRSLSAETDILDEKFTSLKPQTDSVEFTIEFIGAQAVQPVGRDEKSHSTNVIVPNQEFINVPSCNEIWYQELYPNIDLRYYIADNGLKYDFIVHPGGDPSQIRMKTSDNVWLSQTEEEVTIKSLEKNNEIILQDHSLKIFQEDGKEIPATFRKEPSHSNSYGFQISQYDKTQDLIIDPLVLEFSTFIGGSNWERARRMTVDEFGNIYAVGNSWSPNFQTKNVNSTLHQQGLNADVILVKLTSNGTLVYSTYYGGSDFDTALDIELVSQNECAITGETNSNDLPMQNALNATKKSGSDAFVAIFNSTGNGLKYSTYFGGNGEDFGFGITHDDDGIYVVGDTTSRDFLVKNAFQSTFGGGTDDGFIVHLSLDGQTLISSSYIGGLGVDPVIEIVTTHAKTLFITGWTTSKNFPNALNGHMGDIDVFVTLISITESGMFVGWTRYIGGQGDDGAYGIYTIGGINPYVYITGETSSSDFPLLNPYQNFHGGDYDAFLTALNGWSGEIAFSTFIGGSGYEVGRDIVQTPNNTVVIAGYTGSSDFPTFNAYSNTYNGGEHDGFIVGFENIGVIIKPKIVFSTFFGAEDDDRINSVECDARGDIFVSGQSDSFNFPTLNALNDTLGGNNDVFIAKFLANDTPFDDVNPVIVLQDTLDGAILKSGSIIDFGISDGNSGLRQALYQWDDELNNNLSSPFTISVPKSEGTHTVYVYAQDIEGNWASSSFDFIIDNTLPTVSVSGLLDRTTIRGTTIITAIVTDTYGVGEVRFILDDLTLENDMTPPYSVKWNSNSVKDGSYTFLVTAIDNAGNEFTLTFSINVKNAIEIDYGLVLGGTAALVVPCGGLVYWRSYGFRHRRVINLYLKKVPPLSLQEIAEQTNKTVRQVQLTLQKAKKYVK